MWRMTTFQRARSEEQREVRRRAILDAAAAMLAEMPVAEVTLNELSRRAGPGQVERAALLRVPRGRAAGTARLGLAGLARAAGRRTWPARSTPRTRPQRGDQLAAALAGSLAARPVLCDLLSAQAAVLERNVSPQVAAALQAGRAGGRRPRWAPAARGLRA